MYDRFLPPEGGAENFFEKKTKTSGESLSRTKKNRLIVEIIILRKLYFVTKQQVKFLQEYIYITI